MNIFKFIIIAIAGLTVHGTAKAHMLDHFHTHSELSIGFVLIAAALVSGWLLNKNRKG